MDSGTERRHYLNRPFVGRFVRLHPTTWHKRIGMRAAVIGCSNRNDLVAGRRTSDNSVDAEDIDCAPGFIRVNAGAPCGQLHAMYFTQTGQTCQVWAIRNWELLFAH